MKSYSVYYISKENRLDAMMACSMHSDIDWCEEGLKFASWTYMKVAGGESESLSDVFKRFSTLNIDRRRKNQIRAMCLGDVILFDDEPWIVSGFGFAKVPMCLWAKANIEK